MEKICLLCGKKFKTDKRHSYQNYCSHFCNKKDYRENHKEEIKKKKAKEYQLLKKSDLEGLRSRGRINRRRYYKKHKDLEKARSRARYHSPEGKVYNKEYYQKHKLQFDLHSKEFSKRHPIKRRRIGRKSYLKHRLEKLAYVKNRRNTPQGREKFRHYARISQLRRKKQIKKQDHALTMAEENQIKDRDNYKCVYCNSEKITPKGDHIIPLNKGGKDITENVVLACINCNCSKKTKLVFEWCKLRNKEVPPIVIKLLKEQEKRNFIPKNDHGRKIKNNLVYL